MESVILKELVDIYLGVTHTPTYVDEGIPFLSVKDISAGKIDFSKCKYITADEYKTLSKGAKPQIGDMLFCRVGTIGKPIIIPEGTPQFGSFVSLGYLRNKDSKRCNLNYLRHWMNSQGFNKQIMKNVKGASQVNLNTGWLSKFEVPLPNMSKQKYVVEVLDNCQRQIQLQEQKLQWLDELIKSRFVEMFGNLKDTPYEVKSILDLCEFVKDGTHQTPEYTEDKENGYKFLSSKDVTKGVIDWSKIKYIPESLHEELYSRIAPCKGDILLAKNGTTGIAAIVDTDEVFDIYVSLALLRFIEGNNVIYLWAAINSDDTQRQFNASLKGVGVPNLHLGEIKKTKIIVPPIELQNQFAEFVKHIEKLKVKVQQSLVETQILFDSLMQKYFS